MKYIFFCCVLLFSIPSFAQQGEWAPQEYSLNAWNANQLAAEGRHAEAAPLFRKAIAAWNGKATTNDWHAAARSYAITGDTAAAIHALQQLCNIRYFFDHEDVSADFAFIPIHKDNGFLAAVSCIKANQAQLGPDYNPQWRKMILAMLKADQDVRNTYLSALRDRADKHTLQQLQKKMDKIDRKNSAAIDAFLSQHGWPGPLVLDFPACQGILTLLTHAPLNIKLKHFGLAAGAVKARKIPAAEFAVFQDKIEVYQHGTQSYGTQVITVMGETCFFPIVDEANVNKRRKEAGLAPIEEYLRQFGITYEYDPSKPRPVKVLPRINHK